MANTYVDYTKVIQGGEDRVRVYSKEVTAAPEGTVAFTDDDIVTYLSDVGEVGASKETKEVSLFHMKSKLKLASTTTIKDLQVTEALTKDQMATRREQFDNNKFIVFGYFDEENNNIYGCVGQIIDWGATLSDGDACSLTYTLAISDDKVVCSAPARV